ncbi:MAG TPA: C25 family cysteine peptidase, partial [Parasegetibacter sp.]
MKTRNRNTMKLLFTFLLMLTAAQMNAQFNNSWIDYNKTYYKFKVGATGLYRINYSSLVSMGWETIPAEQFQLWRNGQQVPIYTSAGTGPLGPSDYIEFWGERNDGKPDKVLYRDPIFQHTDKISLQTDTAAFFLTVNSSGNNLRLTPTVNNLGGTLPPAEPYFMHKAEIAFNTKINNGKAAVIGEYVYSSSYDQGEMYTSRDIDSIPSNALVQNFTNLFVYNGGPAAKLRLGVCGNALNNRRVNVELNGNLLIDKPLIEFADSVYTVPSVPLSMINSGTASVRVINVATRYTDRMSVSFIELTYPRQFNFGGAKNFEFSLPASLSGNYLEITGFAYGAVAPVLYDLTNGKRYVGNISTPGTVKIMLEPSPTERKLLLVNQESSNYVAVNNFQQRKFIDYYSSDNQGDYIIISNKRLYGGANGNQVERYRQYRSSTVGGGFSAKIYDIDELEDQFAFGIRMHPLSVKDFLRFARANFAVKPKYVFIIGRGVVYNSFRPNQSNPEMASLCLVPTFGYPGSDNMLATDNGYTAVPLTPIGRLSVVTPAEIQNYLDKVIEYEMIQRTPSCNIADKAWMKNVVQVTGASDAYLGTVLCNYMQGYKNIISDSVFGAKVTTFCKTTTTTAQEIATGQLSKLFEEGISVLTYFGHSSASVLEFSISDPENYNNAGKYPVFYVNGCNAGNFFSYDLTRLGANKTLSEKFMLAKDRGTIGFVASTHYGIVNYLNIFVDGMYRLITRPDYGKTLGEIQRDAMQRIINVAGPEDFYARAHAEQITLHGDPYIRINTHDKPDYAINEAQIKVNPNFLTIAEDKFTINAKIFNLGKTSGDSIKINIIRTLPDNTTDTLYSQKVPPIGSQDSIILNVPIIATRDKGINKITVTVDADNVADELCENNNMVVKELVIYEDDARPVYPYNFAIVNQQLNKLTASTSNPFGKPLRYRMEIDTTENFNSPLLRFQEVTASGGLLEFDPGLQFQDSVVYYWRTALVPTGNQDYQWSTASFIYLPSSTTG